MKGPRLGEMPLVLGLFRGWNEVSCLPYRSRTEGFQATHTLAEVDGHYLLASEELHVNACDSQTPGVPRLWEGQAAGKGLEMKT